MLFQILFSLLFLLPLMGTLSVVLRCLNIELSRKNASHYISHILKIMGYSALTATGIYIGMFLLGLTWIADFDLPDAVKLFSLGLAAPYLLSVIGISFAMKNATGSGVPPVEMATHISEHNTER